jgi:hypothetical protein
MPAGRSSRSANASWRNSARRWPQPMPRSRRRKEPRRH